MQLWSRYVNRMFLEIGVNVLAVCDLVIYRYKSEHHLIIEYIVMVRSGKRWYLVLPKYS